MDLHRNPVAFYNQDNKTITQLISSPIIGLSRMEVDATSVQNRYLGYYSLKPLEYYPIALVKADAKSTKVNIIKLVEKPEVKALIFLFPAGKNEFLNLKKK